MRANRCGIARYAAIESVVRAVGRIVVCVDADAEVSTEITSSASIRWPEAESPKTVVPSARKTSSAFSSLPSPTPSVPTPANATVATLTIAYVASSRSVDRIAARPGVVSGSAVSSLIETAVSQPQ